MPPRYFSFYVSMNQSPLLVDKKTLARALSVSVRTISALMASGQIPFLRVGSKLVRFHVEDVSRALDQAQRVRSEAGNDNSTVQRLKSGA